MTGLRLPADSETAQVGSHWAAARLAVRILLIALAVHLLLPQLAGLEASGRALARARRWWLLPLALGLEAVSLLAYAELVRTVLRAAGQQVARGLVQRVTVAGYALGRTLPGGSVAALAVVATELRAVGFPAATTAAALTASGLLSAVVLALLLPAGVALALLAGKAPASPSAWPGWRYWWWSRRWSSARRCSGRGPLAASPSGPPP